MTLSNTKLSDTNVNGLTYQLNYSFLSILANLLKNPIKLAFFTIFAYFSCISDRNWFILHKFH